MGTIINSCINDSIELYEDNISGKIESLFAWYEIELNHSILKNLTKLRAATIHSKAKRLNK